MATKQASLNVLTANVPSVRPWRSRFNLVSQCLTTFHIWWSRFPSPALQHFMGTYLIIGSGRRVTTQLDTCQPMRTKKSKSQEIKRDGLRVRTCCHIFLPKTIRNALVGDTPHFLLKLLCLEEMNLGSRNKPHFWEISKSIKLFCVQKV